MSSESADLPPMILEDTFIEHLNIDPEEDPDEPYEMFAFRDLFRCPTDRVAGFTRSDCIPFTGDDKLAPLKWKSQTSAPPQRASIKLYLRRARLYGYQWR